MRIKLPEGFEFDGAKFGIKFLPNFNPDIPDNRFWFDGEDFLVCPSLPDNVDISDCQVDPPSPYEIFEKPIQTPALYAQDIFVSSRKVKDDPDEAFEEARQETLKPKGQPKSLDLISRSTLKALEQSREKIKELEQTIAALDKRLKKFEK